MAKARWILPEFYTDQNLRAVSDQAALLLPGLWQEADDGNVCPGDPLLLYGRKGITRPGWTVDTVTTALAELEREGIVWPFQHRGERWLYIPRLMERQKTKPTEWRHLGSDHKVVIEQLVNDLEPQKSAEKHRKELIGDRRDLITPKQYQKLKHKQEPKQKLKAGAVAELPDSPSANGGRKGRPTVQPHQPDPDGFLLAPYLDAHRTVLGALPTNPGLLGMLLKPLDAEDREVALRRWTNFLGGIKARPAYAGSEASRYRKFASGPALYDDPDWYLSERERASNEQLLDGLYG